ncbi:AbrB/MazE/SpoVT family DNA-binding domain-containing protein [Pediococcus claussenii]|uniref:SpoVT-AbrB domain-containing protein n=1 Tax=Pediococcus claussenii (strain ATCC BAA-344 / DSM 14800 / JCM 18046 / KCTC 3811 / LMG 21948 / P06) TaxID=701521 RepID=G8PAG6_PEDCP|nr:hypothetical protein [Pediococcus claussenii]AEV95755.1 hypothetical protein PECL_1537 [Pediococcus claussenii ATCC BAA-344]ANZ69264.1 hypothetical protein AYR57_02635 [Pediococcus claussenii]ANZ71083.1 hypothetical protein AYR58_02650 [Pediococcus claussenii]KRN20367.1 hypothetical protein IV79_GL000420 [Pediococcus claussenii]
MVLAKLSKWGNSQGIRISKDILKQIGITKFDDIELNMKVEGQKLIIEKNISKSNLMKRFEDYDYQEYLEDQDRVIEKGTSQGRELF